MIKLLIQECHRRMKDESLFRINKCLDKLTLEQVWESPNKSTNSVGNLILHLEGNIRQYVIATLGGRPDHRKRSQEFIAGQDLSIVYLKQLIDNAIGEALEVINGITEEQLTEEKDVQGFKESVLSILIHVIEHLSYHTGQITFITKNLLDQDMGYYEGLDLGTTT